MSEYYKSLISDDEVIKELIKESKRREGKLPTEASRIKPNLNFFQRTVNNLVSNNNRIDKCLDTFKQVVKVDKTRAPLYKCPPSKKPLIDYAFERQLVLQTKLKFVRARKDAKQKIYNHNAKKIIDELSTESDNSDIDTSLSKPDRNYRKRSECGDDEIICISDEEEVEDKMKQLNRKTKHKRKLRYK